MHARSGQTAFSPSFCSFFTAARHVIAMFWILDLFFRSWYCDNAEHGGVEGLASREVDAVRRTQSARCFWRYCLCHGWLAIKNARTHIGLYVVTWQYKAIIRASFVMSSSTRRQLCTANSNPFALLLQSIAYPLNYCYLVVNTKATKVACHRSDWLQR